MEIPSENEDVSKKLFELCDELEVGELVTSSSFRLSEVMSAIELLEPKMDVGVGTNHVKDLKEAIKQGLYDEDFPMQLAMIDATFAMLVAWLEGSSLASTVWTNVMMPETNLVINPMLFAFSTAFNLMVRNIHAVISSVGNLEELPEDFNPQLIFMSQRWIPLKHVQANLRAQIERLALFGKSWKMKDEDSTLDKYCNALAARFQFIALMLEILSILVPPEVEDPNHVFNVAQNGHSKKKLPKSDEESTTSEDEPSLFEPDFPVAVDLVERLVHAARAYAFTISMGKPAPDDKDGDYTWLPAFDPKACVRMIPACFPRTVKIPTRKDAADWIVRCCERIRHLCYGIPKSVNDMTHLFYFARMFNLDSCVFTRSLMQICIFPTDNHLLGDVNKPVAVPIRHTLKQQYVPQVLVKDSIVCEDKTAHSLFDTFLVHMARCAISVYCSFGCNMSRQRDRLEMSIEEIGQVQYHAGLLENRTDELLLMSKTIDAKEANPSFHSVATFVFHNLLSTVHHYFELGFRMDLYVPYEFTYMFWYMGGVEAKWMRTTMERSNEIQKHMWALNPLSTTVNQRQMKEKAREEEALQKRIAVNTYSIINQQAIAEVCEGIVRLTVVLMRKGFIKVPPGGDAAERLRFERRMEPFECLGPPMHVDYDTFKKESDVDAMQVQDINELIDTAKSHFLVARSMLEQLDLSQEVNPDTITLFHAARANHVACNLLKMDLSGRHVEWSFSRESPLYPLLKITKK